MMQPYIHHEVKLLEEIISDNWLLDIASDENNCRSSASERLP